MGTFSNDVLPVLIPLMIIAVALFLLFTKKDPEKEAAKQLAVAARHEAEARQRKEAIERVMEMRKLPGGVEGQIKLKLQYGEINPALFCQHCQTKGQVRSQKGDSISKTSSGLLNDVLVGGKKTTTKRVTKFHCDNCGTDWEIA